MPGQNVVFMQDGRIMFIFGPVPSRRLGRSLGLDTIPAKACSYSCAYCQLGRTCSIQTARRRFCRPETIAVEVERAVRRLTERGERVDYLTFVADGEPTLDLNLGREIELLRPLGIKIAVITNSSLIWRSDVRAELALADWVSLKVDAVDGDAWRRINRPAATLRLADLLGGMTLFAGEFTGTLATETMLVSGVNDSETELEMLAAFLGELKPAVSYVAVPIRPPTERWATPPTAEALNRAVQIISGSVARVEYLTGYEGNDFTGSGDVTADLLGITAVHPLREDAARELLVKAGADWSEVERLIDRGLLLETTYDGRKFLLRMRPCAFPLKTMH